MVSRKLATLSFVSFVITLITACNITVSTSGGGSSGGTTTSTFSCSAVPASNGAAQSGVPIAINVTATGGTVPYTISGAGNTFDSTTSISRTYSNSTSNQITVNDDVTVTDNIGNVATCSFVVTVAGSGTNQTLGCNLVGNPTTQLVGGDVDFSVTASGGTMPYTFTSFDPGDATATTISALTEVSSVQAEAEVSYTTQGLKTAVVQISDSQGNMASCSAVTSVIPVSSVTVAVTPSGTVPDGSTVTLIVTTSNFTSTPTITFTTTEPNISIVQNGPSAAVTATDNASHNFNVVVTATNGTQSATVNAPITFSSVVPLNCSLNFTAGTYTVGESVTFTATATNGQTLTITSLTAQNGTLVSLQGNSGVVQFTAAGTQTVTAQAQSASGQVCNAGASLQDSIVISSNSTSGGSGSGTSGLTCSVVSYVNPVFEGVTFEVAVTPSYNDGEIQITSVSSNQSASGTYQVLSGGLTANIMISNPNTYLLTITIEDMATGLTGTCSTQEVVWSSTGY